MNVLISTPARLPFETSFSVSLTTEHWTNEIRRSYAMHYGNGILRNKGHWAPKSSSLDGPAFWAKVGLTAVYRKSGLQNKNGYQRVAKFVVDPDQPLGAPLHFAPPLRVSDQQKT